MLWAKGANVWNCTLNKRISKTPYKMVDNSQPNFSYFKKISNEVFHYILKHLWKKLDVKLKKLMVIDYDLKGHAYRLWNSITKKVMVNIDVKINESSNIFLMLLNN
jgi:hypothetical protein